MERSHWQKKKFEKYNREGNHIFTSICVQQSSCLVIFLVKNDINNASVMIWTVVIMNLREKKLKSEGITVFKLLHQNLGNQSNIKMSLRWSSEFIKEKLPSI